jgi:hypothetical protein
MQKKNIEWGKEIAQAGSDVAELAKDIGIPGVGLLAKFAQHFYDRHLQKRFEKFISDAEIDNEFISKISTDETYSNCFYATLETIRQTHSKTGVIALALIYKEHWNNEDFLIAAMQAFSQISDKTLNAFTSLYASIPLDRDYLDLTTQKDGENCFHDLYNEAVELIWRNFFVASTGSGMHANGPVHGMKWTHTDAYYHYCLAAKARI